MRIYRNIETAERYSKASYDEGHRGKAIQKYDQLYKIFDINLWLHTTFQRYNFFLTMLSKLNCFEGTVSNLLRMWSSGLALALNDLLQNVIYDSLEGNLNCQ